MNENDIVLRKPTSPPNTIKIDRPLVLQLIGKSSAIRGNVIHPYPELNKSKCNIRHNVGTHGMSEKQNCLLENCLHFKIELFLLTIRLRFGKYVITSQDCKCNCCSKGRK